MTTQIEETLSKIDRLDTEIFRLKRDIQILINNVTTRYLAAKRNKHPNRIPVYGSISIEADNWDVDRIDDTINVRILPDWSGDGIDEYYIPIKYFTEEETLVAFEEHCQQIKEKRDEEKRKRDEEKARKEYEQLKERFEE